MSPSDQAPSPLDRSSVTTVLLPALGPRPAVSLVAFGALTNVGKVRPNNEDQHVVARMTKCVQVLAGGRPDAGDGRRTGEEGYLLVVADGMGGSAGGEVASARAIEAALNHMLHNARWFLHHGDPEQESRERALFEGLRRLDRELIEEGKNDPALAGMGTTLTAVISVADEVSILHVGDSRAYLLRKGELHQLTHDHTVTQQLVDWGLVRPDEARSHKMRNMLTNVVGGQGGVRGEIQRLRMEDGDRLLLCTDGLSEMVDDARIAELLASHPNPADACRALVAQALEEGGRDNVTVVLAAYAAAPLA
jgi:protein phosphatase